MDTASPPPVDPSQIPNQPARWPKILGIISITLGILGFLQCAVAPVSLMFVDSQMEMLKDQGADPEKVETYLSEIKSLSMLSSVALGVVAILLLVGGILILRKKKSAPIVLQVWSVLKILVGGYFTFRSTSLSRLQMEITMESASLGGGKEAEMVQTITTYATYGGLIFGILWIAALPVFFLIWFTRETVKSEISKW